MKRYVICMALGCAAIGAYAQSAVDAYRFAQPDMKGTARFMSMGGAFTALGADASSISQNPAGLGLFRRSELSLTMDMDMQRAQAKAGGVATDATFNRFLLNNVASIWAIPMQSELMPYLNVAFTYNRHTTFNRRYRGQIPGLRSSLSDYMAGNTWIGDGRTFTAEQLSSSDLPSYDPYNPPSGYPAPSWLAVMGYNAGVISPTGDPQNPTWVGMWGDGTTGSGNMRVEETGSVSSYNVGLSSNFANVVYVGMDFDFTYLDYSLSSLWGESLQNAYVMDDATSQFARIPVKMGLSNYYNVSGGGFNYKFGVIVKPIHELRIGAAVHTPTWYSRLSQKYVSNLKVNYDNQEQSVQVNSNNGSYGYYDVSYDTPWKLTTGVAGVLFDRLILSGDLEWNYYKEMKFGEADSGDLDYSYDYDYGYGYYMPSRADWAYDAFSDPFSSTNSDIKEIYRTTQTLRLGAEYRVTNNISARAGYSHVSSPVEQRAKADKMMITTSGTTTEYRFDNDTNYISCGLGYANSGFYADLAYVWKGMQSEYHAFTPDPYTIDASGQMAYPSPQSKLSFSEHQIVMTLGVKF